MKKLILLTIVISCLCNVEAARWRMKFTYEKPEALRVQDSSGNIQTYWYMIYAITNPGKNEQSVPLELKVVTDDKQTYYNSLYPEIEKLVEAKKKRKFLNVLEMKGDDFTGKIGAGETKLGIAVFGRINSTMDKMNVHITGLVDVISYEEGIVWKDVQTRVITYQRKGDEFNRHLDILEFKSDKWITKKREKIRELLSGKD